MHLILLGAPGAGKGTQAAFLSQKLGVAHVATGDLFRQAVERGTNLGLLAKSYIDKGMLVPDSITIEMVLERLNADECKSGCIFDGFPRTLEQAKALDKALLTMGKAIDKAIYIQVPEGELVRRLSGRRLCRQCQAPYHVVNSPPRTAGVCDKCGGELYQRPDDNEETVKERLKVYLTQTLPLLAYYREQGKLVEVNGEAEIPEVMRNIIESLKQESIAE